MQINRHPLPLADAPSIQRDFDRTVSVDQRVDQIRFAQDRHRPQAIRPFLQPDLEWDFRLDRVVSINVSGHKYGLVAPGVGWIIWRSEEHLPEDLIFHVNYLGDIMPTFALNFSRPGAQVVADRKSTRLNSSHIPLSRMPSSA